MQLTQTHDLGDNTMAQAKTLTTAEIERLLTHINTRKYAARNRSMMLLTHWAGLRIGEVACLRWSDVTTTDGEIKDEIRLLPDMTKGRHARTVFVSAKLKQNCKPMLSKPSAWIAAIHSLQARKASKQGLTPTAWRKRLPCFTKALDLRVRSSHSGRRTFLTNLANKGTAIHILKTLAGHRSISTTAAYLYSSPSQLKAAVELV
jgi:integrase/recombinase XerD